MPKVADIVDFLKQFAPLHLAAEWDNVGLLMGDLQAEVHKVMTCLTVTPESAAEAVDAGVDMIVSHHPILFRPVQNLTTGTPQGAYLWSLARAGVAVYSPHTAFDNCTGGINDILARRLGLTEVRPLRQRRAQKQCKIVTFVPDTDLQKVSDALFEAGAGRIGDYSECSYRLKGTGTFFGSEETNPTVGQKGQREEATEWRLEVVCPEEKVTQALMALRQAHSYEEPAYDVYPLQSLPSSAGEGRLGALAKPVSLGELARTVKKQLPVQSIEVVGEPKKSVQRVAIACGAAGEFLRDAAKARADVFLTGEMRFHDYLAAQAQGISLLLPGHYATERPAIEELVDILKKQWSDIQIWPSREEKDPVHIL